MFKFQLSVKTKGASNVVSTVLFDVIDFRSHGRILLPGLRPAGELILLTSEFLRSPTMRSIFVAALVVVPAMAVGSHLDVICNVQREAEVKTVSRRGVHEGAGEADNVLAWAERGQHDEVAI